MINVEPLPKTQSWRGVRYLKGSTSIPEELAIALGLHTPESMTEQLISKISELANKPPPKDLETLPDDQLPALTLLNAATLPIDLECLPSVGKSTAKTLFERRPEGGYLSLDQAKEINSDKSHIDWEAIALWEAEA